MRLTLSLYRVARGLLALPLPWTVLAWGCGHATTPATTPNAPGPRRVLADQKPGAGSTTDGSTASSQPASAPATLSDAPVSGLIGGKQFRPDKFTVENGALSMRQGADFFADIEVRIFLFQGDPQKDRGPHTITTDGNDPINPHIHVSWKETEDGLPKTEIHTGEYRLMLEFGPVESRQVAGRIDLRLPGEGGGHVAGAFTAEIARDWNEPPTDEDIPLVMGHIDMPASGNYSVRVGYVGVDAAGTILSNMAGATVEDGQGGRVASTTFQPRVTTFAASLDDRYLFTHRSLSGGTYLVYVRWDETWMDWKWLTIQADARRTVDLRIDPDDVGLAEVTLKSGRRDATVFLLPLDAEGGPTELPPEAHALSLALHLGLQAVASDGLARFQRLRPGRYRVFASGQTADLHVATGQTASVDVP